MIDRDFRSEDGRWYMTMYEFSDALAKQDLSGAEWRVLECIRRFAWGDHKSFAELKWKFILSYTGMARSALSNALNRLQERNIVQFSKPNSSQNRTKLTRRYRINSKVSTWKTVLKTEQFSKPNQTVLKTEQFSKPNRTVLKTELNSSQNRTPIFIKENNKENYKEPPYPPVGEGEIIIPEIVDEDDDTPTDKKVTYKIPYGADLLPENPWINSNAWNEFIEHRKNIRHPLTELAVSKSIKLLQLYPDRQQDIVDETIRNNWRGLFAPKNNGNRLTGSQKMAKTVEVFARRHFEREKKE